MNGLSLATDFSFGEKSSIKQNTLQTLLQSLGHFDDAHS